jgi:hypothetical protein
MIRNSLKGVALALMLAAGGASALAQGTAITYQGQLKSSGSAVNSPSDFRFSLFNAASGGTQVGSTVTQNAVAVENGLFTTPVDFGVNPYTSNQNLFLQIEVRNPAGSGSFVPMGSRQALTPAPFSLATRGLNVASNGAVGIGMSPLGFRALTLSNGMHVDALSLNDGNVSSGGTLNQNMLVFGPDNSGQGIGSTGTVGGVNRFGLDFHTAYARRMSITNSGNIGIGTATPANKLSVAGTADFTGNVGIGTTTPAAPLDVLGNLRILSNGTIRNQAVASTFGNHNGLIETFYGPNDRFGMAQLPAGKLALYSGDVFGGSAVQIGTMTGASTFSPSMTVARGGNVGIGTEIPAAKLHVIGDTQLDGQLRFADQTWNGTTGNSASMFLAANASITQVSLNIDSSEIGGFLLRRNGTLIYYFSLDGVAFKTGGGSWAALCDERSKNDIQPLTGTLDRLLKLKGHAYTYKPEFVQEGRALPGTQIGLVAQEVEAVFPDWVSTGPDGMKQVTERSTTALMVEALRDLRAEKDAQIASKDAQIAAQGNQIATLEQRLARIEALLNAAAPQQK